MIPCWLESSKKMYMVCSSKSCWNQLYKKTIVTRKHNNSELYRSTHDISIARRSQCISESWFFHIIVKISYFFRI